MSSSRAAAAAVAAAAAAAVMQCMFAAAVFGLQERHKQYRTPANIIAALLDPANSLPPTDGGNRKPPAEWYTEEELQSAYKEVQRLGTAIGSLPATQLPSEISPGGYGLDARTALQDLVHNGFPDDTISHCAVVQRGGNGSVVSIKWSSIDRRRNAVKTMLVDAHHTALAAVADRVLSQHATVCAVDRAWSELGNMFPANRSRLAVDKGNKMMLVRNSYRLQNNITRADQEVETAFWVDELAETVDEDS
jgi:hypothetical protein